MVDTTESLRERALAAWQERKREMQAEAERRDTEQKLRVVRTATAWALRAIDSHPESFNVNKQAEAARLAGIEAHDPRPVVDGAPNSPWTVDIVIDNITLRYTGGGSFHEDLFGLVAQCPDCGGEVIFGYRISSLVALGIALDEQMQNPKQGHTCPDACPATGAPHVYEADYDEAHGRYTACVECKASPPKVDLDDHGEPMVEFAPTIVEPSQDPAHVLMDALQGYIHAAVEAAMASFTDDEEAF